MQLHKRRMYIPVTVLILVFTYKKYGKAEGLIFRKTLLEGNY